MKSHSLSTQSDDRTNKSEGPRAVVQIHQAVSLLSVSLQRAHVLRFGEIPMSGTGVAPAQASLIMCEKEQPKRKGGNN